MIDLEGISAQALSDTIGAIYDCALDPDQRQDTIQQIVELCESSGVQSAKDKVPAVSIRANIRN